MENVKTLYLITITLIYVLFMLIHKTDKKQNIILWFSISCILILCYNILVCLVYTFLGVLCTLVNLSIFNIIFIIILTVMLIKTKKIQKYYVKAIDIIFSMIMLIIVIFIAYKQYGFPFNIKYITTDGSSHYYFAEYFYEKSTLLFKENNDSLGIYGTRFRLPGAYINEGICFKLFDNVMLRIDVFILFDLGILYLASILFYFLLKVSIKQNKKANMLACIFAFLYMVGYPLNSMLYGYVYLSLALDIIIAFLILMILTKKENLKHQISLPILSLVSLGIFFSYAFFIPIIYISVIIFFIYETKKQSNKIYSTSNILKFIYIILIPLILGFAFFILFPLAKGVETEVSTINVEGKNYENYITNFIFYIILNIIYIILLIKNKKKPESILEFTLFLLSILFAIILFIGNKIGIVSRYYFFKSYYIIWMLATFSGCISLNYILEQSNSIIKKIIYIFLSVYIIAIFLITVAYEKNIVINNIFYNNIISINKYSIIMKREEVEFLEENKNIDYKQTYILASGIGGKSLWMVALSNNQYIYIDEVTGFFVGIEQWLKEKHQKYYLAFYSDYAEVELDEYNKEYEIVFSNSCGFVLKKK